MKKKDKKKKSFIPKDMVRNVMNESLSFETIITSHGRDVNNIYKKQFELQKEALFNQLKMFDESMMVEKKELALSRCFYWLKDIMCVFGQTMDLYMEYRGHKETSKELMLQAKEILNFFFEQDERLRDREEQLSKIVDIDDDDLVYDDDDDDDYN